MEDPKMTEGLLSSGVYRTWFQVAGDLDSGATPLILLHGGPGIPHGYLRSLEDLARDGRPVIVYDQLGCGKSTRLPDALPSFWSIDLFLNELDSMLDHLGVASAYHLLGHSWGGMLGAEHAVRQPTGLRSLILSSSLASSALWSEGSVRLRGQLPKDMEDALDRHEVAGTTSDPEYLAATEEYYARHVCRVPMPDFAQAAFAQLADDSTVYRAMWGPNEFSPVGSLKEWTIVNRLHAIIAPTLVISGEFDEATSECQGPFIEEIARARQVVVPNGSHLCMIEEPQFYLDGVRAFLRDVEG
jgi:L-proline amide hydrolase